MRYSDFSSVSPGYLVPTIDNAKAFVPDPLPPKIDLAEIALQLAEARGKIGELKGACRRLQNPYLFIKPLQRLEAQTSSSMEGTYTTADKLALAEAGVRGADASTQEVVNYIDALETALASLNEFPITHRTLKQAHLRLLSGVGRQRGEDKLPGEFKRDQNMIGATNLEDARFVPTTPQETPNCISRLEEFINSAREEEYALIDIALVHYQFETIHPFADGNGRLGRMLISLMAVSRGLLDVPALFVSPALEGVKDQYIEKMYRVSAFGEWHEWLNFFFETVAKTASQTIDTIDRIITLQERYKTNATLASTSTNLHAVIDMLFEVPVIRPKDVVKRLGITDAAARNLLSKLVEINILVEVTSIYPKAWIAFELIQLSSPES